jgi:hypothetical protein
MRILRPFTALPRSASSFLLVSLGQGQAWAENYGRPARALGIAVLPALFLLRSARVEIYNVLWVLVFAFATLNILSLGARHFESERRGLTFGEILAILVVMVSIVMLTWEMLNLFKIFPLRLAPR